ncbi:hypothetical protein [Marinicella sp. W31]|uniref:hypothetical protein n=1 Tax=Marinicella sp. W31 TaxID=3023713 RepID=UPI0037568550
MKNVLSMLLLMAIFTSVNADDSFDYKKCHLIQDVKVAPIQYDGQVLTIPADADNDSMTVNREYQIQFGDLSYVDEILVAELWDNLDQFFALSQEQAKSWSDPKAKKPDHTGMIAMCESLFAMVDIENDLHSVYPEYRTIVDVRLRQ